MTDEKRLTRYLDDMETTRLDAKYGFVRFLQYSSKVKKMISRLDDEQHSYIEAEKARVAEIQEMYDFLLYATSFLERFEGMKITEYQKKRYKWD